MSYYQINRQEMDAYDTPMVGDSDDAKRMRDWRIIQLERYLVRHLYKEHHMRIREIASELGMSYTTVRLFATELKNHGRRK